MPFCFADTGGVVAEATKYLYASTIDGSQQTGVVQPDSSDSLSQDPTTLDWSINSGSDDASTTYNLDGATATSTDPRGVVHSYSYVCAHEGQP